MDEEFNPKVQDIDSWRTLERLAFRGRQGQVKAFACIAIMADSTCAEILNIPEDERVRMCGLVAILQSEVQTLVPIADLAEIGIDREKTPIYDTRKNGRDGIFWRGWKYEYCVALADKRSRLMVVEDHDEFLLVSDYESKGGLHSVCQPVGDVHRVNRIAPGRPTLARMNRLGDAIKQANELLRHGQ